MYLLDSSAIIEILRGNILGAKVKEIIRDQQIAISSITVHEVAVGENSKTVSSLLNFFSTITILPFDKESALQSFKLEQDLKKNGRMIERSDMFIAGICIQHNLTLVTLDKGFKDIDNLKKIII